jgi:hypothetical protein
VAAERSSASKAMVVQRLDISELLYSGPI